MMACAIAIAQLRDPRDAVLVELAQQAIRRMIAAIDDGIGIVDSGISNARKGLDRAVGIDQRCAHHAHVVGMRPADPDARFAPNLSQRMVMARKRLTGKRKIHLCTRFIAGGRMAGMGCAATGHLLQRYTDPRKRTALTDIRPFNRFF